MKAIIKAIIRPAEVIKHLFTSGSKKKDAKVKLDIARLKPNDLYTKKIFTVLKGNSNFPFPPLYRSELKMVHRRLVQYQRLRWHGSHAEKAAALKKLEKEWNRLQRNHLRKIKSPASRNRKIIPVSSAKE